MNRLFLQAWRGEEKAGRRYPYQSSVFMGKTPSSEASISRTFSVLSCEAKIKPTVGRKCDLL